MDSMLVKRALLIYIFDCFAEIMVIIYFAFPALSLAYQVNVAQNLHKQKGNLQMQIFMLFQFIIV